MKKSGSTENQSASELIDKRIAELADWRGETLSIMRKLIQDADPDVVEEVKWRKPSNSMLGVPVWSHDGIICTGETYKDKVKLTFSKGASLPCRGRPQHRPRKWKAKASEVGYMCGAVRPLLVVTRPNNSMQRTALRAAADAER
ncbi:MAG: DUF1801 domain-containing protein [Chloroflexi bacterium]|nr:DUF1801 domain-containing protein [Chloroflexota bacterium]